MHTVLTYGTFDLFHYGHLCLLERAKNFGSKLFVGISTDRFNSEKGKSAVVKYVHRAAIVNALKCVDGVFPEDSWHQKEHDIKRLNARFLVMGDDWKNKFNHLGVFCKIIHLSRTPDISSSLIKYIICQDDLK